MAASFYADCRRVKNDRIKRQLGVTLAYPDYRTGLEAQLADDRAEAGSQTRDASTTKQIVDIPE